MNASEAFAERTIEIETLALRLDRLIDRRARQVGEGEEIQQIIQRRHREGQSAASLVSDITFHLRSIRSCEKEIADLLDRIEVLVTEGQSRD